MKRYIYGAVLVAVIAAVAVFFFKPPETNPPVPPSVLAVTFHLPEGYEFTQGAPFLLTWRTESPGGMLSVPVTEKNFDPRLSPYKLMFRPQSGAVAVILSARLYYCDKTTRMCFQDDYKTRVPLEAEHPSLIPWVWDITPR